VSNLIAQEINNQNTTKDKELRIGTMKVTSKTEYKKTKCIYKNGKQIVGTIAKKKTI
jgi:hypothetical protein